MVKTSFFKPLEWHVVNGLIGRNLVARDPVYHMEFARLDNYDSQRLEKVEAFKVARELDHQTRMNAALNTPEWADLINDPVEMEIRTTLRQVFKSHGMTDNVIEADLTSALKALIMRYVVIDEAAGE